MGAPRPLQMRSEAREPKQNNLQQDCGDEQLE